MAPRHIHNCTGPKPEQKTATILVMKREKTFYETFVLLVILAWCLIQLQEPWDDVDYLH
jgi:hypothetical protein